VAVFDDDANVANDPDRAKDDDSALDADIAKDAVVVNEELKAHEAVVANEADNPYDALLARYEDDANVANEDDNDCDAQLADTPASKLICVDPDSNPAGIFVIADQSVPVAVAKADHSVDNVPYLVYNVELRAPFRRTNKLPTGAL
jgi:hypothetical protein